jgi:hypothetical protein
MQTAWGRSLRWSGDCEVAKKRWEKVRKQAKKAKGRTVCFGRGGHSGWSFF